jgi:Fe-S-cluster containining protein
MSCDVCGGCCCKGVRLNLGVIKDPDARRWLEYHGELQGGMFVLDTPCRMLEDGDCSVYDQRPEVCRRFEVGSDACRDAIQRYGGERVNEILATLET